MLEEPRCFARGCKHFKGVRGDEPEQVVVCAAFPKGIPNDIAYGDDLHTSPREGDHGITFEKS